jgi:hypothetical protein
VLVAALSQLSEFRTDLELLESGCNADLLVDQVDALWIQSLWSLNSLVAHVLPDGTGE